MGSPKAAGPLQSDPAGWFLRSQRTSAQVLREACIGQPRPKMVFVGSTDLASQKPQEAVTGSCQWGKTCHHWELKLTSSSQRLFLHEMFPGSSLLDPVLLSCSVDLYSTRRSDCTLTQLSVSKPIRSHHSPITDGFVKLLLSFLKLHLLVCP